MKAGEICHAVALLVGGDRAHTHGTDKARNHANIAALWNAYLSIREHPDDPLTALDVAHMMVLLKTARTQYGDTNPDDHIDMVGYAAIAGEIAGERDGKD